MFRLRKQSLPSGFSGSETGSESPGDARTFEGGQGLRRETQRQPRCLHPIKPIDVGIQRKKTKQTDSCGVMLEIIVRNEELVLQ